MTFRILCFIAVLGFLSGCVSIKTLPEEYETPEPLPRAYLEQFCYQAAPIVEKRTLVKENRTYRLFEASIEAGLGSSDDESPITFEYYEPISDEAAPVALLLPILNGLKHTMRPFASHFARHGYAVIIVDTVQRRTLLEDLSDPEPAIQRTVQRHRRVIDWVETQPKLDVSRLGVFGASLGGFNALFLAALDDRVGAVAPALVGGSLPDVLMTSNEGRIEEAVAATKAELSLDDSQLVDYLTDKIQTDTLTLAHHVNADRVLMIMARRDKSVPFDRQLELREAMGNPRAILLPTGHYTAAAYIFYLRKRVRKFFDQKFAERSGSGTAVMPAEVCSYSTFLHRDEAQS